MKRLLVCLLFLLTQPALATSIVILVTPDYIIIGSDSKRLLLDAEAHVTANQSVCKIHSAGKYCFALAGFSSSSATSFSADSIVSAHLNKASNYTTAIENIKAAMKSALRKELQYQQRQNPDAFATLQAATEPLLELVVLSIQHGMPQMQILGFELGKEEEINISSYEARCPGDCPQQQQFYFMGSYKGMEQYLDRQTTVANPAQLVEQLIIAQAKATPSSVGAPVNLVKYSAAGMEWIK